MFKEFLKLPGIREARAACLWLWAKWAKVELFLQNKADEENEKLRRRDPLWFERHDY